MRNNRLTYCLLALIWIFCSTGCGGGYSGGSVGGDFSVNFSSNFDFSGYVRSSSEYWNNGTPIEGVNVTADTGAMTLTASNGYFLIKDISGGTRYFNFMKEQFESVSLEIDSRGDMMSVRVQFPPLIDAPNKTTLRVVAHGDRTWQDDPSENDFMTATEIHLEKAGDREKRWAVFFDDEVRTSTAIFSGVEKGVTYNLEVDWSNFGSHTDYARYSFSISDTPEDFIEVWR